MADVTTDIFNINSRNTDNLKQSYDEFQKELIKLDTHNNMVGSINRLREDRIEKNQNTIGGLDADLMTTRRQVEIIQNRNLIKEDVIDILRMTFVLLSALCIVIVYVPGDAYKKWGKILLGLYAVYYYGNFLLSYFRRSNNRWTLINWQGKKYSKPVDVPVDDDICAAENAEYEAEMAKIKGRLLDKMIAMKTRFNSLETNQKTLMDRKGHIKQLYDDTLKQTDRIFDKLSEDKKAIVLEAKKKKLGDIQKKA
jgi:hypothetical protein